MGKIVLLDELTINQIAAGEVIERPASVVKEMVENSIDAGATNITVEIKNGGISFIKVTDNGKGIAEDDLEIAFERHATSKIRSAKDLDEVTTMGFRGEALASIAAIANVEMISKTEEQDIGYKVVCEAGNILEKEEIACPTGTTITVKNLFFNTPVRYKFLKKDYTESGYIEDVITRIALVNPNISIKLINTGKTVISTNGNGDLKSVVYSIYGKDVANGIMEVSYSYEDINITGVIGKPEIARSNRSNQMFFVNKRYIKDKTLTAATEQSYKGLIPIGKFGFVVLNLEMNPAQVDVNVHPAKLEVRFEEENKVFQAVYHAIKDTLLKDELVANAEKTQVMENINPIDRSAKSFEERLKNIREGKKTDESGLFSFRKQNEKKIEEYIEEESNIKTNAIENKDHKQNSVNTILVENKNEENEEDKDKEKEEKDKNKEEDKFATKEMELEKIDTNINENKTLIADLVADGVREDEETYNLNQEEANSAEEVDSAIPRAFQKLKEEQRDIKTLQKLKEEQRDTETFQKLKNEQRGTETLQKLKEEQRDIETFQKLKDEQKDVEISEESEKTKKQELEDNELEDNEKEDSNFDTMYTKLFGTTPIKPKEEKKEDENSAVDIIKDNISVFDDIEEYKKPQYKFVGIVFKTYIILEIDQEMYILDQHAAHERIMYEKVKKNYYSESSKDSQMLLLPDIITLSHKEMDIARENIDMFEKAGFTLEEFGDNTIKLTGAPTMCIDLDTKELFLETLDEINTVARTAKQEKEEKFIATVACKAAIKANMALTTEEVESLMDELLELPNPFTCPHGRPTVIKMSKYDIERKFSRK